MIVRTLNSTYEVERDRRRFRRVEDSTSLPTHDGWRPFVKMGAVVLGEPLHFFTEAGFDVRAPGSARVWTTTPVVEVAQAQAAGSAEGRRTGGR
jgi:hypothetical protein